VSSNALFFKLRRAFPDTGFIGSGVVPKKIFFKNPLKTLKKSHFS